MDDLPFYLRSKEEQLFYKNLTYNIQRYQHLQQLSDKRVSDFLGIKARDFSAKKHGIEHFTAYELFRLSQMFQTGISNLIAS